MSTAEITAYLYGVRVAQQGLSIQQVFLRANWREIADLDLDLAAARLRLGNDTFAYWVRRGMDEGRPCRG